MKQHIFGDGGYKAYVSDIPWSMDTLNYYLYCKYFEYGQAYFNFFQLESAGLTCWMDVGQMGGGDRLYNEIYRGIYSCQVGSFTISNRKMTIIFEALKLRGS